MAEFSFHDTSMYYSCQVGTEDTAFPKHILPQNTVLKENPGKLFGKSLI